MHIYIYIYFFFPKSVITCIREVIYSRVSYFVKQLYYEIHTHISHQYQYDMICIGYHHIIRIICIYTRTYFDDINFILLII